MDATETRQRYRARMIVTLDMLITSPSLEDAGAEAREIISAHPGFRAATLESIQVTPLSLSESLLIDNLALWQESEAVALGTVDQRLRWGTDALSIEEIADLARPELFRAFSAFRKYNRMPVSAIPHPRDNHGVWTCAQIGDHERDRNRPLPIAWSTLPTPVLSPSEWNTLRAIGVAIDATNRHPWLAPSPSPAATVATRIHKGTCKVCDREAGETAALVTISWAGRTLSREYRL